MNVFKFINSKSIAKYLETIGYKFNALEAAYLVWQSKFTAINEKIYAWEQIINEMSDMSVAKRRYGWETDEPSLHAFLRRYIDFVESFMQNFFDSSDAAYSYEVLCKSTMGWVERGDIYTSFEKCKSAVDKELDEDIALYSVKKTVLNGGETIKMLFNANGEAVDMYANQFNNDDSWLFDYFEGLWFKFPTPFKRGDIVYQLNRETVFDAQKRNPFVLTDMCTWGEKELRENGCADENKIARCERLVGRLLTDGDISDMLVSGHWIDDYGKMYTSHTWESYLDLEYYDGEIEQDKKFLTALSNYEKGKIDIELLLNTYMYLYNDFHERCIEKNTFCRYLDEQLKLAEVK